jgi:hypothetical protein
MTNAGSETGAAQGGIDMTTTTAIIGLLAAAGLSLVAPATAGASATAQGTAVSGKWNGLVSCALTAYDPITHHFTCEGSTLWTGALEGVTYYTISGTINLLTSDSSGTIDEDFVGKGLGRTGSLHFTESFTLDGKTSRIHIDATAVGGTRGFSGTTGHLVFVGTEISAAEGYGTYAGTLAVGG